MRTQRQSTRINICLAPWPPVWPLSDYPTVTTNMFVTRLEPGFKAEFAESAARTAAPAGGLGWHGEVAKVDWRIFLPVKYSYPQSAGI